MGIFLNHFHKSSGLRGRVKAVGNVIVVRQVEWSTLCKRFPTLGNMHTTRQVWNMFPGNNIVKQNSPQTTVTFLPTPAPHTQSPRHLPAPHQQPTAEPAPSRPSFRTSAHAFTATRSLSLSLSLDCFISPLLGLILAAFYSAHCVGKYTGVEKQSLLLCF